MKTIEEIFEEKLINLNWEINKDKNIWFVSVDDLHEFRIVQIVGDDSPQFLLYYNGFTSIWEKPIRSIKYSTFYGAYESLERAKSKSIDLMINYFERCAERLIAL